MFRLIEETNLWDGDVLNCNDFIEDIWNNKKAEKWRKKLLDNNRNCPIYNISPKKEEVLL